MAAAVKAGRREPEAASAESATATDTAASQGAQSSPAAAAGDSFTVAAWTAVSRFTGVAEFAVIGAVLGPTFLGNTYQFTNQLPNLVYYGFLAGSLFVSLLVPAIVSHIDAGDRQASERVAGGFLGVSLVSLAVLAPVAVFAGPLVLRLASLGGTAAAAADEERVGQLMILMVIPQIFCYGVVAASSAVMYARRRFALPAAAPAMENLGTIAVLVAVAVTYGTGTEIGSVPPGEVLLLGLGSTGAVALHAAVQWWGARRAGVTLMPRPGWRDPEVRAVIRRALPSLAQAGLLALQMVVMLAIANRLPGGVVAFQIALNFYYLAIALGAQPIAVSLLPRLSRMHTAGDAAAFREAVRHGLALGLFITVPAAVGYLALAGPLASAISFGRMHSHDGVTMVAVSLAALSAAVVSQTIFMIETYACYARKDTRSPLTSMTVQTVIFLALMPAAVLVRGWAVVLVLGLAQSLAVTVGAGHLAATVRRRLGRGRALKLAPSLAKFTAGAVIMAGPAWLTATAIPRWLGEPAGPRLGVLAAAVAGCAVYIGFQALWRSPEIGWLVGGLGQLRGKAGREITEGITRA